MSCITLLSDLGLQDASVASVKGTLMKVIPKCNIIDVTHHIEPFHLSQAAYLLTVAVRSFPEITNHMVISDIFYDRRPKLLLAEINGHYVFAPDNGIIPLAYREVKKVWQCYDMPEDGNLVSWVTAAAGIIRQLQDKTPAELNLSEYEITNSPTQLRPVIYHDSIEGRVMHIDRFQNVVLNITRQDLEEAANGRSFAIYFIRDESIEEISHHYNSVREGYKLCRFNSSGYLEIAINKGSAAKSFGFNLDQDEQLFFKTVKIIFT